jgi:SAM-dependent methyltransferase
MYDIHRDMKRYYEEWWENARDPRGVVFEKLNELALDRVPRGQGKRALDVGSGKGTIVSLLRSKGYRVTAVEINEAFSRGLKRNFPEIEVIEADFNAAPIYGTFDIVTAIEFVQNLDGKAIRRFLEKVSRLTDRLIMNISNKHSLHGFWTAFRGFQKPFVHTYTPCQIERMLEEFDFQVTYTRGVGFLTPITLFPHFRWRIIPAWVAKTVNTFGDSIFPRLCHLYYLEAKRRS